MSRWLPVAAVLLALTGVAAYGLLRPGVEPGADPADVQRRLDAVPPTFEGWAATAESRLSDRDVNLGGFQAHLNRTYAHPAHGVVTVLVLYGEPGDLGAHDPRVCYAGSGWVLAGEPCQRVVGEPDSGETSELWSARFRQKEESLQVYWGWGVRGDWRAAHNPRFEFARHRRIFKVYAQQTVGGDPSPSAADPLTRFLPAFLRRVDAAMTPDH